MNLNKLLKLDKLFKSKILLFIVFILTLVVILKYLMKKDYNSIIFFTIILLLTRYFFNNLTIILGITTFASYLLHVFKFFPNKLFEGAENITDEATSGVVSPDVATILNHIVMHYLEDEVTTEDITNGNTKKVLTNIKPDAHTKALAEIQKIQTNLIHLKFKDIHYLKDLVNMFSDALSLLVDRINDENTRKMLLNIKTNIIPIIKKEFNKVIKQKHLQSDTNTEQNIDDIKTDFNLSATNPNSTNMIGDGVGKTALIINKSS